MTLKTSRRTVSITDELDGYDSPCSKENDKSIPFLRRLVDMLKENKDVISFYPGSNKNGKVILARIEVHNRAHVEDKILPRYFNHSSFASLRRQLNYFCFTRLGKGRQKGAAYCNDSVVVLDDILKLKRRPHVGGGSTSSSSVTATPLLTAPSNSTKHQRSVSISSTESNAHDPQPRPLKKPRVTTITPLRRHESMEDNEDPPATTVLDLTIPRNDHALTATVPATQYLPNSPLSPFRDDDLLAGCRALLSFSRGPTPGGLVF